MGAKNFNGAPAGPLAVRINNAAAAGDSALLAAVAGQKHRIYGFRINVAGATVVQLKDGAGTVLEVFNFAGAGGGTFFDLREEPYYTSAAVNTTFVLSSSNAVQVDGRLEYATAV